MNTTPTKKKSWLIAIIIIVPLAIVGYIFKWDIYVQYYNLTKNHFKPGDKVYADPSYFKENRKYSIGLWQVVKPVGDTLKNAKPYAMYCNKKIITDKLVDEKSGFLGTYLFHGVLDLKAAGRTVFTNFYAIKPNMNVYEDTGINFYKAPKGYQWADSTLYVLAIDVNDKESFE